MSNSMQVENIMLRIENLKERIKNNPDNAVLKEMLQEEEKRLEKVLQS